MGTLQPKGESMRKAVRWISDQRREKAKQSVIALVDAASIRFNLSPEEAEFLMKFVKESQEQG